MNKNVLGIIVAIVVIGGGAWYFSAYAPTQNESGDMTATTTDSTATTASTSSTSSSEVSFRGSMSELIKRGGSYKCTVTFNSPAGNSDGTVYVSGDRLRGDFKTVVAEAGLTVENHMLGVGGYLYNWNSMTSQGFKSKMSTDKAIDESKPTSASESLDYNQALDYKCVAWDGDASLFEFPKGIVFSTI
ncbi:MAG: hypothetical protein A2664_02395 [Candidatus Taylorbacteria bacterium RIFCSPHIGHO2_01_FULL_46_22b]|uniref:Uncharacterized protein n=1 Tax=Candidatus Taylorbacteria bacterium RIFCSPHIGHO2_01_FULL_46_22b TaxID=1802301 RepID=A0A1G2M5A2_9BACT|nr:MAG: hypothetical protein A2664_02395 [Candidatus Taylorbacteria bacterium RIFCSPHIGHO2_01_FULL_46_22b]